VSQTKIFEYMENQQPVVLLDDHKIQVVEKGVFKIINQVGTAGLGQLLLEQEYDLNGWYLYIFEDNYITINHYTRSLFLEKLKENLFVDSLTKEAVPESFLKYLPLWCKICKDCEHFTTKRLAFDTLVCGTCIISGEQHSQASCCYTDQFKPKKSEEKKLE